MSSTRGTTRRFSCLYPRLVSNERGKIFISNSTDYGVRVRSKVSTKDERLRRLIEDLPPVACILMTLNSSRRGVTATIGLHKLFTQLNEGPVVRTVMCGPRGGRTLSSLAGFHGRPCSVRCVNSLRSSCSRGAIVRSSIRGITLRERLG